MRGIKIVAAASALALCGWSNISAAEFVAICPDDVDPDAYDTSFTHTVKVTTSEDVGVECYAFGTGNLPDSNDITLPQDGGPGNPDTLYPESGSDPWYFLESVTGGNTANSGTIDPTNYTGTGFGLLIKYGNEWAFFTMDTLADTITYSIDPQQGGGLSHASLFCSTDSGCEPPEFDVPEPGTLALLGLGLAGLGFGARRRKA